MIPGISWLDVKMGLRMLVKYPGLALVGGLGMAVGMAIGTAVFDVTSAVFTSKLPFVDGDRVVTVSLWDAASRDEERRLLHDFGVWRRELRSLDDLAAFRSVTRNLVVPGAPATQV